MSSKEDKRESELDLMASRLRSPNGEREDRLYHYGSEAGEAWAKKWATPDELQKLDTFRRANEKNFAFAFDAFAVAFDAKEIDHPAAKFVFLVRPSESANGNAPHRFWLEFSLNGGIPGPTFVGAFAEAAMDCWDAVQRKLAPPRKIGAGITPEKQDAADSN